MFSFQLKRFLKKISLLFLSLLVVEACARFFYVEPWYLTIIRDQQKSLKMPVHKNAFGLRGDDVPKIKQPHIKRILFLGDSFTYGQGVNDERNIFPRIVAEKRKTFDDKIEFLNGGIPGSLTSDWLALMKRVQSEFKPDLVLVTFSLRDGTKTSFWGGFLGPLKTTLSNKNKGSILYRHLYLYRLFKDQIDKIYISKKYTDILNTSYTGRLEQTQEWVQAQKNILAIKELAEHQHAKFGFVIFPIMVDFKNYRFLPICKALADFCSQEKITYLDLLPFFKGHDANRLCVSVYDHHPNEDAHAIAGEAITPFVRDLLKS